MDDFEDMLKKAMEAETQEIPSIEDMKNNPEVSALLSVVEMGSLLRLGKAAQERSTKIVENLADELATLRDKADESFFRTSGTMKIEKAAKSLRVLHTIITAASIMGVSAIGGKNTEGHVEQNLDMILNLMNL